MKELIIKILSKFEKFIFNSQPHPYIIGRDVLEDWLYNLLIEEKISMNLFEICDIVDYCCSVYEYYELITSQNKRYHNRVSLNLNSLSVTTHHRHYNLVKKGMIPFSIPSVLKMKFY